MPSLKQVVCTNQLWVSENTAEGKGNIYSSEDSKGAKNHQFLDTILLQPLTYIKCSYLYCSHTRQAPSASSQGSGWANGAS